MKIFVAGATGAVGRQLIPMLVERGEEVVGLVRSAEKKRDLETMGCEGVIADPLDRKSLIEAIVRAEPEIIVHQLTALSNARFNFRRFDDTFALTNRFRREVTDTLIEAGRRVGVRRMIAQSYCGWPFEKSGSRLKDETAPLDPDPPSSFRETLGAIRHLEDAVSGGEEIEGIVLRYANFYGPGTSIAPDGEFIEPIRRRQFPLVGDGQGIWSFVHIRDVALATVAALTEGKRGVYNIVDDNPAPIAEWLPYLAELIGAPPPRHIPVWLARIMIGEGGVAMMTTIRGGKNDKAKRELNWRPTCPSWREGFAEALQVL